MTELSLFETAEEIGCTSHDLLQSDMLTALQAARLACVSEPLRVSKYVASVHQCGLSGMWVTWAGEPDPGPR